MDGRGENALANVFVESSGGQSDEGRGLFPRQTERPVRRSRFAHSLSLLRSPAGSTGAVWTSRNHGEMLQAFTTLENMDVAFKAAWWNQGKPRSDQINPAAFAQAAGAAQIPE